MVPGRSSTPNVRSTSSLQRSGAVRWSPSRLRTSYALGHSNHQVTCHALSSDVGQLWNRKILPKCSKCGSWSVLVPGGHWNDPTYVHVAHPELTDPASGACPRNVAARRYGSGGQNALQPTTKMHLQPRPRAGSTRRHLLLLLSRRYNTKG